MMKTRDGNMPDIFARLAAGVLVAALALQSQAPPTWAAKFKLLTDPKKTCSAVTISGDIVAGDYNRFAAALKKAASTAPVRRLYLNSAGGQILAAFAITDLIRQRAPTAETIVQSRQICNSACVIILTVGVQKYVSRRATVIIHRAFDEHTRISNLELTKQQGEFMVANGMPPSVIQTMANLGPKEEIQITRSNAKKLGFGSFEFYKSANPPATPQCSWAGQVRVKP